MRVWDLGTGAHDATLTGHVKAVCALAVHGDRLFSASFDGTILEWALGMWAPVRTVEVYELVGVPADSLGVRYGYIDADTRTGQQIPYSLAVCGSNLIGGSAPNQDRFHIETDETPAPWRCEVRVWDLETLECKHTLPQPPVAGVWCLVARCGEVWGVVGQADVGLELLVWGRA